MTESDLSRIETRLGIILPKAYLELMRARAEELKRLTYQIRGVTHRWFDDLLYLDAARVIDINRSERRSDSGTTEAFPKWSKTFFLIGTNGAGAYYCLRLKGDRKVWMIGSDCGDVPKQMYGSLAEFVDKQVQRHAKEPPWQPPPVLSSFNNACPLMARFGIWIGRESCQIKCQEGDRPVNEEKLRLHGIDVGNLGRCVLRIVGALAKCDPDALTIEVDPEPASESLKLKFSQPTISDPRFRDVRANIFQGNVSASLLGPTDTPPPPANKVGIDWVAFRKAVMDLLRVLHPPGTRLTMGTMRPPRSQLPRRWSYNASYALK